MAVEIHVDTYVHLHTYSVLLVHVQWNPSKLDTIGTDYSVLNSEAPSFQGLLSAQFSHLGLEKCPVYGGVLIFQGSSLEGFHCIG